MTEDEAKRVLSDIFAGEDVDLHFDTFNVIRGLKDHPNVVVREFFSSKSTEDFAQRRRFWDEQVTIMTQRGVIHRPQVEFVKAQNPAGHEVYYAVSERVEGKNFDAFTDEELIQNLDVVEGYLLTMIEYYAHCIEHGGEYLQDLGRGQFVYGKTERDEEDKLYIVDLDIIPYKYNKDTEDGYYQLAMNTKLLFYQLRNLERKIEPRKLTKVRAGIQQLLPFVQRYPDREFEYVLDELGM